MNKIINKPQVKEKQKTNFEIEKEHQDIKSQIVSWSGKTEANINDKLKTSNELVNHLLDLTTFDEILEEK